MHRLFVYGTLRHAPLLDGLVGTALRPVPAKLRGYRAARMRGRSYPGLVVDPEAVAPGSLVEVDAAGLDVLDRFEGSEYTRTKVTVVTEDRQVDAETYLLTGASRALAEPDTWSLDDFVSSDADRWVQRARPGTHHPTE